MSNKNIGNTFGISKIDKYKSGIWNNHEIINQRGKNSTGGSNWYADNNIKDHQVLYVPLDNTSWDAYGLSGGVGIVTTAPNVAAGFTETSPANNFGITACMFNTNNQTEQYITIPASSDFALGSSDFTIDIFLNRTSTGWHEGGTLIDARNADTNYGPWYIAYAGSQGNTPPTLYVDNSNGANTFQSFSTATLSGSTWFHYRWSRNGDKVRAFTNGTLRSTTDFTNPDKPINTNNYPIRIGVSAKGYFGHLRIIKGIGLNGNDSPDFYAGISSTSSRLPI
jgi:hypothetical protein